MSSEFEKKIEQAKREAKTKSKEEKAQRKIARKEKEEEIKSLLKVKEQLRAKEEESVQNLTKILRDPLIQIGARDLLVDCKKKFRNEGRLKKYRGPYEAFGENYYHHKLLKIIEGMNSGEININSNVEDISKDGLAYDHTGGTSYPKGFFNCIANFSMTLKGLKLVKHTYLSDMTEQEQSRYKPTSPSYETVEIHEGIHTYLFGDNSPGFYPSNVIFVMNCNRFWHTFLPGSELPKRTIDGVKDALVTLFIGQDKRYK